MSATRVLISTIAARTGGVPAMLRFALQLVAEEGMQPEIACYQPYSLAPELSVPFTALGRRDVGIRQLDPMFGVRTWGIGARLPELEFTTYALSAPWRRLIDRADLCLTVSGNVLAARPFALAGRQQVAWIATPWAADRIDRVRTFPPLRRLWDRMVVAPATATVERDLLARVPVAALSTYTARALEALGGRIAAICPAPVDAEVFQPHPGRQDPRHLVFSGRLDDPRKNVGLLLDALLLLRQRGVSLRATLVGARGGEGGPLVDPRWRSLAADVQVLPYLQRTELAALLQGAALFVLPSHQEGLCIAALEAMACGVPVVSTRCGGPEEFVIPGETGLLVDFEAAAMADAIAMLLARPDERRRLGDAARDLVVAHYAPPVVADKLRRLLHRNRSAAAAAEFEGARQRGVA